MKNLQLKDIIGYLDLGDSGDSSTIQVVTGNREWDDFEELYADSALLKPFMDYYIWCMDAEKSQIYKDRCVIRVDIHEKEYGEK